MLDKSAGNGQMSCPTKVWSVEGPGYTFAFIMMIAFPIMVVVFLGTFLYFKNSSVFLRKRPVDLTLISIGGGFVAWGSTALYDVIGSGNYPCWLHMLMVYLCVPFVGVPVLLKMFRYAGEVSAARLLVSLSANGEGGTFVPPSMWVSFLCYAKVFFGNRDRMTRLKSHKFVSSKFFSSMWIAVAVLPYLLVYTIRLFTSTAWRDGCYGCEMETPDAGFLFGFYVWGTVTVAVQTRRMYSRDALRIKREAYVAWIGGGCWITLAMLLFLIDPNDAYVKSQFNFRIFMLMGSIHVTYVQTAHQVIIAKLLHRKLLLSPNFNREDLFTDVMQDKELSQKLRTFLQGELSGEILLFLDAVDQFRRDFDVKKESRQRAARDIYDQFIIRRAPTEINLSHDVREAIITRITPGNVNVHVYDEAYVEIRSALLRDGFTRFLNAMRKEASTSAKNAQVTIASSVAYSV